MFPIQKHYELKNQDKYRKWHIEGDFEKEIMKLLRADWYIRWKRLDIGYGEKYLDCHFESPEWECWWIEFKKIKLDSFNISQFEQSQILLLPKLDQRNPDRARVFIYSEKHKDYKVYTFSELWNSRNEKGGIKIFSNKE